MNLTATRLGRSTSSAGGLDSASAVELAEAANFEATRSTAPFIHLKFRIDTAPPKPNATAACHPSQPKATTVPATAIEIITRSIRRKAASMFRDIFRCSLRLRRQSDQLHEPGSNPK